MPGAGTEFHDLIPKAQLDEAAKATAESGPNGAATLLEDVTPLQALAQAYALNHISAVMADPGMALVGTFLWAFECGARAVIAGNVEDVPFTLPAEWLENDGDVALETIRHRVAAGDSLFRVTEGADA